MKKVMAVVGALVMGSVLMAGTKTVKKAGDDVLSPGRYAGTIKAFVCGGCGEWVETKLSVMKSLENVSADQKTRVVQFAVKKGAKINRSDLQKVLDAAAREMGMGADFTLIDLKKI
jgi:predicted small secreted protein